ncbi:MAG TPA: hypothetical protein DIV86_05660, partial [Alphaproteobacteria bacterium]|nr:hypothetical protein [Alphaproteobacteria bacterium]
MSTSLAGEIALIANGIANVKPEERKYILMTAKQYMHMHAEILENQVITKKNNLNRQYPLLINGLNSQAERKIALFREDSESLRLETQINKDLLVIIFSNKRLTNPSSYIFVMWVLGSAILL